MQATHALNTGAPFLSAAALRDAGAELDTGEMLAAMDNAWADIRSGKAFGSKAVLSLPEEDFWRDGAVAHRKEEFADERLGWKLSCLYSVNERYGGVKIIGANAFNRQLGLPRSTSTIVLMEKRTLRVITVMDGTGISARRTGSYATMAMDAFCRQDRPVSVLLFGTGPTARAIVECLGFRCADRIGKLAIQGRSIGRVLQFIEAIDFPNRLDIQPAEETSLSESDFIITATNARAPIFAEDALARDAVSLHLGGDEVPESYLQRVLRTGLVVCDDLRTVSHRNSQSIALHFSRRGLSLDEVGPLLGLHDLTMAGAPPARHKGPVCVTCVGLPMLDLYAAQATYEKYCRRTALDQR